ncbi:hypothetical protein [Mesorhizobium sp.]|uniref:hypothetical protein n=1 Tax=Mesorhizobium sp. TaxID=1871066 RepID=UPI000FE7B40A|nr:hypothetical protein [Mesorhizobium sp.]RWP64928.1 MAG: hypothetical protein EOR08_08420 [Mesorhizobium sp.]
MANEIRDAFNVVYADGPVSSPTQPPKDEIRAIGSVIQGSVDGLDTRVAAVEGAVGGLPGQIEDLTERVDEVEALAIAGIKWTTQRIEARSTANVDLATGLVNGQTLNGVTVQTGLFYFIGSQTNPAQNGIYPGVAAGASARATFADSADELAHVGFVLQAGTVGTGERWTLPMAAADITVGTTPLVFAETGIEPGYAAEVEAARGGEPSLGDRLDDVDDDLLLLNPLLGKIGNDTLYIDGQRVLGGFEDSNGFMPLVVLDDGTVLAPTLQLNDAEPQFYFGKRIIGGFKDTDGRYPLAVHSNGMVYIPNLRFDTTDLEFTEAQIEDPLLSLLRSNLILPSKDIAAYGDSLTAAMATYLTTAFSDRTVYNRGIGGQRANQIAMRQGGKGFTATASGNQIVSGANTITHFNGVAITGSAGIAATVVNNQPLSTAADNTTRTMSVVWCGITGTVERTASGAPSATTEAYSFTPDGGQTLPVTCPPDSPMIVQTQADAARSFIWWSGRNSRDLNNWSVVDDVKLMLARQSVAKPRGAILSIINGEYATEYAGGSDYIKLTAANAELAAAFPDNYVDVRRYLIDRGLAALSITPTAQDLIDIGNDIVPDSLRIDNVHLTNAAYNLVALYVKATIFTPNGW